MKKLLLLTATLLSSGLCLAQEVGHVISATPIIQQVGVPRQVCTTELVDGASTAQAPSVQRCSTQTFFENRPVAYNVIYEFGGKQYSVQMPTDPGPTLQLQVTPVGSTQQMPPAPGTVTNAQPSYVVVEPPVYPGYYEPDYFLPFVIGLGFGYWSGWGGYGGYGGHGGYGGQGGYGGHGGHGGHGR